MELALGRVSEDTSIGGSVGIGGSVSGWMKGSVGLGG